MKQSEQAARAAAFARAWKGKGYEKGDTQPFWTDLLRDVFGVEQTTGYIVFEDAVHLDSSTGFIDAYIPATRVMIEQKSLGKDLEKPIKQSDGSLLTPFQQAKKYIVGLKLSEHPRWVVTCNFAEFLIYDMEDPDAAPQRIALKDLRKEYYRLSFLVDEKATALQQELEVSIQAGDIVGELYAAFSKQYVNPTASKTLHSLNVLCVRLVFCLYAEDSGIFPKHAMFHDYLAGYSTEHMRTALLELFQVLDTEQAHRDPYLAPSLDAFPYVNGGLFKDTDVEIPLFTDEIRDLILVRASEGFDWSGISPTIFGAVFESTLNPVTRRQGGMHYTSVQNIHKVLDPLFLDDLRSELDGIFALRKGVGSYMSGEKWTDPRRARLLREFRDKLAGLRFLDPACGSGNFLTETYLSLRRMENRIIRELLDQDEGQFAITGMVSDEDMGIKVSIGQFYGIEINDFAVSVARTALWIAEHQMMRETSAIINREIEFLPLKTDAHILEGNALRMDWKEVIPPSQLSYIIGNPPFVGYAMQTAAQKDDLASLNVKFGKNVDYVAGWYFKSAEYMKGTGIEAALVSTNSITQGEQVAVIWKPLMEAGLHINFAHRTFRWDSEASIKAHVHCVIVGFSMYPVNRPKRLFTGEEAQTVSNINGYLVDAENVFIERRSVPLMNVPEMRKGSQPTDNGNLSAFDDAAKDRIIKDYPQAEKMFRPFLGAVEYLHRQSRWCLWLQGFSPAQLKAVPPVFEAVRRTREMRESSSRVGTKKAADVPMLFGEIRQPSSTYILIPRHSSENRRYVPFGFIEPEVICGDSNMLVPDATPYHLGVMISIVHMAWMRTVCGRLKSDYRYSKDIVYNNFPWPDAGQKQKEQIRQTALGILTARDLYPDSSLADLYDDTIMPIELRKAHRKNDEAVLAAYGLPADTPEPDIVAHLMELYQKLTGG